MSNIRTDPSAPHEAKMSRPVLAGAEDEFEAGCHLHERYTTKCL